MSQPPIFLLIQMFWQTIKMPNLKIISMEVRHTLGKGAKIEEIYVAIKKDIKQLKQLFIFFMLP